MSKKYGRKFFHALPAANILGLQKNSYHSEKVNTKLGKVTEGDLQTIIRSGVR